MRRRAKTRAGFLLAYALYVAFLNTVPGPWRDWKGEKAKATDPWTLQHVIWGAIASAAGYSQKELLALGLLNELVELAVRRLRPDLLWGTPETPANVVVDLLAAALGHRVAGGSDG